MTNLNPCACCGELTNQLPLSGEKGAEEYVCTDCDSEFDYCCICNCHYHKDFLCRHIFYSDDLEHYAGTGSGNWVIHKESLLTFLEIAGKDFAKDLATSLRNHKYSLRLSGTIFNYDTLDCCLCKDYYLSIKSFTPDCKLGVQWLLSLWSGEGISSTTQADTATAEWIEEWLAKDSTIST